MKRFIKSNLKVVLAFIIGGIIFSGTTLVLAGVGANQVTYTNNGQTTVEGALDTLYSKANWTVSDITYKTGYHYETQYGDTYTATEAGLYLVVGVNYAGNTSQIPGLGMSTSGSAKTFITRISDNTHGMQIKGYIVRLNQNDTVKFSGYNSVGEWPFVTMQIWKIG